MLLTIALACALGWTLASSEGPASNRVSVLPTTFEGPLEEHWQSEIGDRIGRGFSQGDFTLVDDDPATADAPACADAACFSEIASATLSHLLVVSSVRVDDKDYALSLKVVDGSDGSTLATVDDTCGLCGALEAAEMATDLASTLRSKLDSLTKAKPSLVVTTTPPGVTVLVDGTNVGKTPLQLEVDAGEHAIVFEREGFVAEERTLSAVAGVEERVAVDMTAVEPEARRRTWAAGWSLFGIGVAGVAAGSTLLALHGRPYRADCEADADGDCRNLYDTRSGGIVGVAIGGASLLTGIALVAVDRARRKGSSRRARFGPTSTGLAARF